MQLLSDDAIVLRHRDYGEADRIVTLLTKEHGVLKGFARHARKSRRRFGPALESFARVRLSWTAPKGEGLAGLREAEILDLHMGLRSELLAVALASYAVELVESLFGEGHAHPETFTLLAALLAHLAADGYSREARLLFELRLLQQAGYLPHLLHCSLCDAGFVDAQVFFAAELGGALCPGCARPETARSVARLTLGTIARCVQTPEDAFAGFRFSPLTRQEARRVLGDALHLHLSRPLKSLAFLASLEDAEEPDK